MRRDKRAQRRYAVRVTALRLFLMRHRWLAASIVAAALVMRVLVPAGYMVAPTAGGITIELCNGVTAPKANMHVAATAMAGMHHGDDKPAGHAQPEMPCAFAALGAPSLAAADPLILAVAILFILGAIFRPTLCRAVVSPTFLRPPLRGPPAIA